MRTIAILALLFSAQASAWPWTTVDDCVEKYAPKAESSRGAKIVRGACVEKYGKQNGNDNLAECLLEKVPPAKTDDAAGMLYALCQRENPPPPPPPLTEAERKELAESFDRYQKEQAYWQCMKKFDGQQVFINDCEYPPPR